MRGGDAATHERTDMGLNARVKFASPRFERTPESLIFEGVVTFESDSTDAAKSSGKNGDGWLLTAKMQMWRTRDGNKFIVGYREQEAYQADNGKCYTRPRKTKDGKYVSATTFGPWLSELAITAIDEYLEADAGRGGDGGFAAEDPNDFSAMNF